MHLAFSVILFLFGFMLLIYYFKLNPSPGQTTLTFIKLVGSFLIIGLPALVLLFRIVWPNTEDYCPRYPEDSQYFKQVTKEYIDIIGKYRDNEIISDITFDDLKASAKKSEK